MKINLKKFFDVVSGKKNALILIYSNPDPDALASAWALKKLMEIEDVSVNIQYTGEVGRLENQTMITLLGIPVVPVNERDIGNADLIALVDAQFEFYKGFNLPRCDMVIDHHPLKGMAKALLYADIRPGCLATSSILVEYLRKMKLKVSKKMATALYYGIQTDSFNTQKRGTIADKEAISFLESKIDRALLKKIEFSLYSLNSLDYFGTAIVKLRSAENILYVNLGSVPSVDVCAQVGDFLIRVKETEWAVVSGVSENKLIVVFRCDGNKKHAGKIAEVAFGELGSAGGHRSMARAEINGDALPKDISLTKNEAIESFVLQALAKHEKAFKAIFELVDKRI